MNKNETSHMGASLMKIILFELVEFRFNDSLRSVGTTIRHNHPALLVERT